MPAKGYRKSNGKTQAINLRVEPEWAARLKAEAGEDSVSASLRVAAEVGLDTLDRRRKGLGSEGKLRVELTEAEERLRDRQRRYAEAAARKRESEDRVAQELAEKVLTKLRERPCRHTDLLYGAMERPNTKSLRRALNLLEAEGRIQTISVGTGRDGRQARAFVAVGESVPASVPTPVVRRVMDELVGIAEGHQAVTKRALRERVVVGDYTLARAIAMLLAEGRLRRIGRGVYALPKGAGDSQRGRAEEEGQADQLGPEPSAEVKTPAAAVPGEVSRRGPARPINEWPTMVAQPLMTRRRPSSAAAKLPRYPSLFDRRMNATQFAVFRALMDLGETTIRDLADAAEVSPQTVSSSLSLFARAGLARRLGLRGAGRRRWAPGRLAAARMREADLGQAPEGC